MPMLNPAPGLRPHRATAARSSLGRGLIAASLALSIVPFSIAATPRPAGGAMMPAFPGAQGYGKFSQGGRGGRIIQVTTLADGGPGSLRACIDATGPRVCVFRVGGVIRYTSLRPVIVNPYITIAGETAPGGGILLTHAGGEGAFTPLVIKDTHDVVVRNIRVRTDRRGAERESNSAIVIQHSRRVILDHVSTSWSLDENVGLDGANDEITVSNSIMAEGVLHHSKCALLSSRARKGERLSFVGNLCVHDGDRNPDINFPPTSCVEVVNNVLYNAKVEFAEIWESHGGSPVSIVGNYFRAGPSTSPAAHGLVQQTNGSMGRASVFETGNVFDGMKPATPGFDAIRVSRPPCPLTVDPVSAASAYKRVLAGAGAQPRDDIDRRLVKDVVRKRGRVVAEPGKLPIIAAGLPYADSDADGMSDEWEKAHGLDPRVNDAWDDAVGDGWSNLDRFLDDASRRQGAIRRPARR